MKDCKSVKVCAKCRQSHDSDFFHKDKSTSDGLRIYCKSCVSSYVKSNKEKKRAYDKERRLHDKERRKIYSHKYYQDNKQKIRIYNMSVYNGHRGVLRSAKFRVRLLIREALRKRGGRKAATTLKLLGADSWEALLSHIGECPGKGWDLDHICPCAQARNEQELLALQHFSNLRWTPAVENRAKSAHRTEEGEALCMKLLGRGWLE